MRAALLALLLALAVPAGAKDEHVDSPRWTRDYDGIFQKYTQRFFGPGFEWRWFKAQAIAESTLRADAKSGVGAVGLMQIMPATFVEIQKMYPELMDLHSPRWNIAAGICYDRYLFRHKAWAAIAENERLLFTFASYNSGMGGALRAYRKATPPVERWDQVAPHAHSETRRYVERIVWIRTGAPLTLTPSDRGLWAKLHGRKGPP